MISQIWYVVLGKFHYNLKNHLIPNILTPHLIRWTEKCRRSDYCYANGPKIKIAVSPNDMPLSLQRTDIIGALCNFLFLGLLHNSSHCVYIFRSIWSNEVSKCLELIVFKILTKVCQKDTPFFELWEWHIIRTYCKFYF